MSKLESVCKDYMDYIEKLEKDPHGLSPEPLDDLEHYIFEAAMEHFYGPKVWEKINAALL